VTPARNEAGFLVELAATLNVQAEDHDIFWVLVSDASTDDSQTVYEDLDLNFPSLFLEYKSTGKLISGGAYQTWRFGVQEGMKHFPDYSHVMKLDADVLLSSSYLSTLFEEADSDAAVLGGRCSGFPREQTSSVPGPVKMYSRSGYGLISTLPHETGFDVMDEVLCASQGLTISIVPAASFSMARRIGVSEGVLHGRFRNGLVCKWTGYAPEYFLLHLLRHAFRSPILLGAVFTFTGYLKASDGPYPSDLRKLHAKIQRKRLRSIIFHPIRTIRLLYFPTG
jgi:glycosyltransferase involved in cell wall biosynthesis